MKERGMIFGAESVRAILAGTKTQTRRLYRERPVDALEDQHGPLWSLPSPYGSPGDILWVREGFALAPTCEDPDPDFEDDWSVVYRVDWDGQPWMSSLDEDAVDIKPPWKSPLFMPRWASRLTLEIIDVRVERLQAISEDDARAEGCKASDAAIVFFGGQKGFATELGNTARGAYAVAWDAINFKRASWASNPFVWALTFRRLP